MARTRSSFTTDYSEDRTVAILVDLNGEVSVTNDAEQVVRAVFDAAPQIERIVYRDSDRQWDEIVFTVKDGRAEFRKFSSVDAKLAAELNLIAR
jgi:hypothetical protein